VVSAIVPSTLGTALAPNIPVVTAEAIAGTTLAETSGLSTEELIK